MKNSQKRLDISLIVCLSFVIAGCDKELKLIENDYAAKVGSSVLTEKQIQEGIGSKKYGMKLREEFVREWVNKELLYQKAVEEGITSEPEYLNIIDESRKELAAGLFLERYLASKVLIFSERELSDYFYGNVNEFIINHNALVINKAAFSNYEDVIFFRNSLLENDWDFAVSAYRSSRADGEFIKEKFLYEYDLQPLSLLRAAKELMNGEISIIIEDQPGKFLVVQLVESYAKGSIPSFKYLLEEVKERYAFIKLNEKQNTLLAELYTKYDVKIK